MIQPFSNKEVAMVKQSLAGYIRQHLAELETRMEYGVKQVSLVEELNALGYATTITAFRNYLARARVWRKKKGKAETASTAQAAAQPGPPEDLFGG
jgi:hypothetical protein